MRGLLLHRPTEAPTSRGQGFSSFPRSSELAMPCPCRGSLVQCGLSCDAYQQGSRTATYKASLLRAPVKGLTDTESKKIPFPLPLIHKKNSPRIFIHTVNTKCLATRPLTMPLSLPPILTTSVRTPSRNISSTVPTNKNSGNDTSYSIPRLRRKQTPILWFAV